VTITWCSRCLGFVGAQQSLLFTEPGGLAGTLTVHRVHIAPAGQQAFDTAAAYTAALKQSPVRNDLIRLKRTVPAGLKAQAEEEEVWYGPARGYRRYREPSLCQLDRRLEHLQRARPSCHTHIPNRIHRTPIEVKVPTERRLRRRLISV